MMLRKKVLLGLALSLVVAIVFSAGYPIVYAQDGENPWTTYQLNMRTGAGTGYATITTLPSNTPLVLEGRSDDIAWVLGHTEDGAYRGWVASLYLTYPLGYSAARLPVTTEMTNASAPAVASESDDEAPPAEAAPAPGGVTAYTNYQMNVRSGPGTHHSAVGRIPGNSGLVLEARNADATWVLAHTADNTVRGWLASLYLRFTGASASSLPHSNEIVTPTVAPGDAAAPSAPTTFGYDGIVMGSFDPATVAGIDLAAYPVVGRATGRSRAIFLNGRAMGNNPNVVAKVGDCSSEHWYFLKPFSWNQYSLGAYTDLQDVVNHFGESWAYDSEATHNGFNVNAILGSEWANPAVCQPGESPLLCEYRVHKPSVSIIMFGTSDLLVMSAYEFDFYLRDVVQQTIDAGVIPILSTFPGNKGFWNRTILYNQIVVRIALDYDIPLINLWLALESLSNQGLESDGFHLGEPPDDNACFLTDTYLTYGYPMRNLVTVQTLDAVWRGAMQ